MKNVEILNDFLVAATGELYIKGYVGEVNDELAKRHGKDGTGCLKVLPDAKPNLEKKK